MAAKKKKHGKKISDRVAKSYDHYVGAFLAPKSKVPVDVWVSDASDRFYVLAPNREQMIGAGYYGDEDGPNECIRQHMLPGLENKEDKGTGLGTTLYLAGVMVAKANEDDEEGEWPWANTRTNECTYSYGGDRSADASRAWESLRRHDLAEAAAGESEYVSAQIDADDVVSESEAAEHLESYSGSEGDVEVESISGSVEIEGYVSREADVMEWTNVEESGLVLYLGPDFSDPFQRAPIPPDVMGGADWAETPWVRFQAYVRQNAAASAYTLLGASDMEGDRGTEVAREYVRAVAAALTKRRGATAVSPKAKQFARQLLSMIGQGPQQQLPGVPLPSLIPNPASKAQQLFAGLDKQWAKNYGRSAQWNPRKKLNPKTAMPRRKSNPVKRGRKRKSRSRVSSLIRKASK